MEELKVGQRIELFKILGHCGYSEPQFTPGTIRPGVFEEPGFVEVLSNTDIGYMTCGTPNEVRNIGAMVITKIKEPYKLKSQPYAATDKSKFKTKKLVRTP